MKTLRQIAAVAGLTLTLPLTAFSQNFPTKPLVIKVGFAAGGTVDGVARIIAPALGEALGQTVTVENRPGATGAIAAAEVAQATGDGHVLHVIFDSHAVNHHLYKKQRYDVEKSFTYLSRLVTAPQILVASTNIPANTPEEFVKYAKDNPGKLNYASTGSGSSNHLNGLLLNKHAGITAEHLPYKGGAPAIVDMTGNQGQIFMIVSAPNTMPHVHAGRIKVIGVGTTKPVASLPGLKPISDAVPGYTATSWVGIVAPGGLPEPVRARLQKEINKVMQRPDISERLTKMGYDIVNSSGAEFESFIREQSEVMGKLVRDNKLQLD